MLKSQTLLTQCCQSNCWTYFPLSHPPPTDSPPCHSSLFYWQPNAFTPANLDTSITQRLLLADGGDGEEEGVQETTGCGGYIMHFLTLFWKILFAFVPPAGTYVCVGVWVLCGVTNVCLCKHIVDSIISLGSDLDKW